jgi:hypothetical protein
MIAKASTRRIALPRAFAGHRVPGRNRYHLTARGRVIGMAQLSNCSPWQRLDGSANQIGSLPSAWRKFVAERGDF